MEFLYYDGTQLFWIEDGKTVAKYAATSGHGLDFGSVDYQKPESQCEKDEGPIPEGNYKLEAWINNKIPGYTVSDGHCTVKSGHGIQEVPVGKDTDNFKPGASCIELWGPNRVKLQPFDDETKQKCGGRRNGFYLHDSHKGGSSGCIEIGPHFFQRLREWVKAHPKKRSISLAVHYLGKTTRGNTER